MRRKRTRRGAAVSSAGLPFCLHRPPARPHPLSTLTLPGRPPQWQLRMTDHTMSSSFNVSVSALSHTQFRCSNTSQVEHSVLEDGANAWVAALDLKTGSAIACSTTSDIRNTEFEMCHKVAPSRSCRVDSSRQGVRCCTDSTPPSTANFSQVNPNCVRSEEAGRMRNMRKKKQEVSRSRGGGGAVAHALTR